ncbi:predicted protein [Histoplasma capsulatum var. duboisii H88]|uniref:Predicted protein n=2 Tax=Ajellomyces capsulatus TaxID=5037 RepID=F0U7J2_AJEC8|nr:predicted protein [Histoplasma capsulatum H143]EGC40769.1 predicted protein [Histoplasma capsulatum var. duboisii H88]
MKWQQAPSPKPQEKKMENKQTKKEADSQLTESNSNGGMAAGSNHQEGAGWAGNAGCRSCRMRLLCILSVLCLSGGRIRSKVRQMVAQNRERRARTGMQGLRLEVKKGPLRRSRVGRYSGEAVGGDEGGQQDEAW